MKSIKKFGSLLLLCGFMAVSNIFAGTLSVTKIADSADSVCDADCSLREAVSAANSGDVIVFSPLFDAPQTIVLTGGQITIDKNLTIAGAGADALTVNGNNANRIFYISGNAVVALNGMKLTGGAAGSLLPGQVISNPNGGAIFLTDSTLTLTNMMLSRNGTGITGSPPPTFRGNGGAIFSYNSTLTIINSSISNNVANNDSAMVGGIPVFSANGGSIYLIGGTINISNSTISNNSGGIVGRAEVISRPILINVANSSFNGNAGTAIEGSGRISVINTTIRNNGGLHTVFGGGIYTFDSLTTLTVDRSIISNNTAVKSGGGVHNAGTAIITNTAIDNNRVIGFDGIGGGIYNQGTMYVTGSAVTNNQATSGGGGGVGNFIGQLFLTNSTISGNVADSGSNTGSNSPGGGIYNFSNDSNLSGRLVLTNSTIANNHAAGEGGGVRQDSLGIVTFRNTIVAGNSSRTNEIDVSGTVISQGFNLIGNNMGSSGWTAADLLNQNPLLAPLGNNGGLTLTHALMPGSPAINNGNNALAVDPINSFTSLRGDQRGFVRVIGGIVDIGAYESDISNSPVTLSGRVLTVGGRGVANALITLTDGNGTVLYARTNSFGYYRFENLPPGVTYTITVTAKRYKFDSPQTITVDRNRNNLNFTASL